MLITDTRRIPCLSTVQGGIKNIKGIHQRILLFYVKMVEYSRKTYIQIITHIRTKCKKKLSGLSILNSDNFCFKTMKIVLNKCLTRRII